MSAINSCWDERQIISRSVAMERHLLINTWVDLCADNIHIDSTCLHAWYCFECAINNSDASMSVIGCTSGSKPIALGLIFLNRMLIMSTTIEPKSFIKCQWLTPHTGRNRCKLYFLKVIKWCYILGVWMIKWVDLNTKKTHDVLYTLLPVRKVKYQFKWTGFFQGCGRLIIVSIWSIKLKNYIQWPAFVLISPFCCFHLNWTKNNSSTPIIQYMESSEPNIQEHNLYSLLILIYYIIFLKQRNCSRGCVWMYMKCVWLRKDRLRWYWTTVN